MLNTKTLLWLALNMTPMVYNNLALAADAEQSSDHDSGETQSTEEQRIRAAQARLLDAKPDMGPLLQIMSDIRSDITPEKFNKLVDKTEGLDAGQKKSLKDSFRDLETQVRKAGDKELRAGDEFIRALTGTLKELEAIPRQSKTDSAAAAASPKIADAKAGEPAKGEDKAKKGEDDPTQKIIDLITKSQEQNKNNGNAREQEALRNQLRDLIGNKGDGDAKGDNAQANNQNPGGDGKTGGAPTGGDKGQTGRNKSSDKALNAIHDTLKDKNQGARGVTINNTQAEKKDDEKKSDRKERAQFKAPGGSVEELEAEIEKEREEAKKKADAKAAADQATGAMKGAVDGAQPPSKPPVAKKALSAMPFQGSAFNPPGGIGAGLSDLGANISGGLAGATVAGSPQGVAGGGGDFSLGGMKFDDGYYGPGGGGSTQFQKSGGFQDAVGSSVDADDADSLIADVIEPSASARSATRPQGPIHLGRLGIEETQGGHILQENAGNLMWRLCATARSGQVGACSKKRFKKDLNRPTTAFTMKELDA